MLASGGGACVDASTPPASSSVKSAAPASFSELITAPGSELTESSSSAS
jgi:hypothetical protein